MKCVKEFVRHFHAWAGIQRTRHEHRCAVTQPPSQTFNANNLNLNSTNLRDNKAQDTVLRHIFQLIIAKGLCRNNFTFCCRP
jgi:hypothetical protein